VVYQKPTCTKCRETLRLLKERGVECEAINYYETPFTEKDLRVLPWNGSIGMRSSCAGI